MTPDQFAEFVRWFTAHHRQRLGRWWNTYDG
jgi:hypothetical protein